MNEIIYKKYNKNKNIENTFTYYEYTTKIVKDNEIKNTKICLYKI